MTFFSFVFWLFLPLFLIIYYLIPQQYRYIVVLIGSYLFYGYGNPKILLILILITVITYIGGIVLGKRPKKKYLTIFFLTTIFILFIFKYLNFTIQTYKLFASKFHLGVISINEVNVILPIGLSFIIFQSCTYLTDVYRKNIEPEKNLLRYGAFVAFFPTVLSGPIQKARNLLPQIKCPQKPDGNQAKKEPFYLYGGCMKRCWLQTI